MKRKEPRVKAMEYILQPAEGPQASFQWSWGAIEEETCMESMLPAQHGTHLAVPCIQRHNVERREKRC